MSDLQKLDSFKRRMDRIGIHIDFVGNLPWIYIDKINGIRIKREDYFYGDHGFTVGFLPIRVDQDFRFTDNKKIFELIRKYTGKLFKPIK